MQIISVQKTLGMLVVATSLLGCATTGSDNSEEIPALASAMAAANSSYVNHSMEQVVKTGQEKCVRTVNWNAAKTISECDNSMSAAVTPEPQDITGASLVSFNGRALFDFDSATLTDEGRDQLNQLTAKLNAQDEIEAIEIAGHTDNVGSDEYNQTLSESRAEAVKNYLQRSLQTVRVRSKGMGETAPIADNDTEAGRRLNRRVDVNIAALVER